MIRSAARELASYQDEPKQLRSGAFGKSPYVGLGFVPRADRSVLATLHRRAPYIVQQALYWDEAMPGLPCVTIISNAGGVLQGDRNVIEIEVADDACAHVTTQSATRIHEMDANYASQVQTFRLGARAYLEYVPHPIIPHARSRFAQETAIVIDPTATLVYAEVLLAGRKHYGAGEIFAYDLFSALTRGRRPDGATLFAEKLVIEPRRAEIGRIGAMGGFHVFGSLVVLAAKRVADSLAEAIEPRYDAAAGIAIGASRLPNDAGVIVKVLGMESAPVVTVIRSLWAHVRREAVGAALPGRFLWA